MDPIVCSKGGSPVLAWLMTGRLFVFEEFPSPVGAKRLGCLLLLPLSSLAKVGLGQ